MALQAQYMGPAPLPAQPAQTELRLALSPHPRLEPTTHVPRTVWLQLSGGLLVCAWSVLTCHLSAFLLSRVLHKGNAPAPAPLTFSHPGPWGFVHRPFIFF